MLASSDPLPRIHYTLADSSAAAPIALISLDGFTVTATAADAAEPCLQARQRPHHLGEGPSLSLTPGRVLAGACPGELARATRSCAVAHLPLAFAAPAPHLLDDVSFAWMCDFSAAEAAAAPRIRCNSGSQARDLDLGLRLTGGTSLDTTMQSFAACVTQQAASLQHGAGAASLSASAPSDDVVSAGV